MILHLPLSIWQQIHAYTIASLPNEVTGIGAIHIASPREACVTQIFLPEQEVCASYSKFAKGELGKIISNFAGNDPTRVGKLCFRWHSHAEGKVFWSAIDEQDIASWKGNYVFNLVTNANGDYLVRLDSFKPFRFTIPDVQLRIDYPNLEPELWQLYTDEVKTKTHPIPPKPKKLGKISDEDFDFLKLLHEEGGIPL